ncbi:ubiquitin carboxyl-terminal hydrolase 8 [Coffea arabica]|uniref:Ubiquitin carboxyl-terminal hydrolase n=1 Tax=Coffea arabica TaxID=13443 RepID=A0A6P6TW25_COFAR|nr:ubiquitin carboxyl-terminal hydrolase 8-like [Coffea arabica]
MESSSSIINSSDESSDCSSHSQQQQQNQEPHEQLEEQSISGHGGQRVYLVPLRWWKETRDSSLSDEKKGILYTASPMPSYGGPMKLFNNFFSSDLSFNLRKEDHSLSHNRGNGEVGVSGRDYALVSGEMWLQALKWHSDSKIASKDGKSSAEEDMSDVYPLQLRLVVLREADSFGVKISKKENTLECFRRACKIFSVETELLRIWDFSGEMLIFFLSEKLKMLKDSQRQSEQDMLLELQVYGLSDPVRNRGVKRDDMTMQHSNGGSLMMNGCTGNLSSNHLQSNSNMSVGSSCEVGTLGLTGLQNLGNTCFMNSAIQCLAHTPKMVDYFLGDFRSEINHDNPLGMNGEIASAFGDLLKKLWAPGAAPVAPRIFKSKLAHFAPQFSGFNQHDSQELLSFLLDGLHEDLNRVKCKPYAEVKDGDDRPDEEVADEYWRNHLARNDSIIVDVCQGQYRSTLVCPICRKVSVTFDPFMYLSLPLPSTSMRTMTITVMRTDDSPKPTAYTITVPKTGKLEDLIQALSNACSLGAHESLLVAEIFNNRIIRFLEESANSLSLIRDEDRLIAYQMTKEIDEAPLVVFTHQQMEEQYFYGKLTTVWKAFGIPLVARSKVTNGSDVRNLYMKSLLPFSIPKENSVNCCNETTNTESEEIKEIEDALSPDSNTCTQNGDLLDGEAQFDCDFEFYLADEQGNVRGPQIAMDEPVNAKAMTGQLSVIVRWADKMVEEHSQQLICSLPEVFKSGYLMKRPQESVSLYKCLEAFLKEEPLGPEDMWYCPVCKKHCQASKKLDLWRLPEVLVIHLKRFSYSRFLKNKLETYVDFPVHNLDLSAYIAYKSGESCNRYVLYAISNHYGSMGGGHYTAFVHHGGGRWFDFDDSHVSPINEDKIKSSAAYVLFYRRVEDENN